MLSDEDKWLYLRDVPHRDASDARIQTLAHLLRRAAGQNDERFASLCMHIAKTWIRQTSDVNRTGGEDIAGLTRSPTEDDAVEALMRGADDCDAKARLFVALCLAGGVNAKVVGHWSEEKITPATPRGRTLTHVCAAVYLHSKWLPVELTLARALLGEEGSAVPKEIGTKQWRLP